MDGQEINILLVDDEETFRLIKALIDHSPYRSTRTAFQIDQVESFAGGLHAAATIAYDIILIGEGINQRNGLDLISALIEQGSKAPILFLVTQDHPEAAEAALSQGAADCLFKEEISLPLLDRSIRYAIERKDNQAELERLVEQRTRELARAKAELETKVLERTDELRRRAEELQALQKATSFLLKTLDVDELLGQILDAAQSAIPAAQKGWLHLVAPDTGQLQLRSMFGFRDPRIRKFRFREGKDYPEIAVREKRPFLIDNVQADPLLVQNESSPDAREIRSLIVTPLVLDNRAFGSLSLSSSRTGAFSDDDLRLLSSFAATTTAAIQNAMLHAEVQKLASTDPLTGQYNRRAFFELGGREMERFQRQGQELTIIMFDIDHFKLVNDRMGHTAGDQVLRELVERCSRNIRREDIFARYGGDEFVILLPRTDLQIAREIAERIQVAIKSEAIETDAGQVRISISTGVAKANGETRDLYTLLAQADAALYQAKMGGRDRIEIAP